MGLDIHAIHRLDREHLEIISINLPGGSLEWYYFKIILTPFHIVFWQGVTHVKLQRQVFSTPPSTPTQCLKHVLKYEGCLQRMPRQYASEISE